MRAWVESSWFLGDFVKLPEGGWLFQTWAFRDGRPEFGLVRADANARRVWEVATEHRLLSVDEDGLLYLWDPAGQDPARVRVARFRWAGSRPRACSRRRRLRDRPRDPGGTDGQWF